MNTASAYRGRVFLRTAITALAAAAALTSAPTASASRYVQFGIQDDAWLLGGPGTFDERLEQVKELGVDVVRITVRWDRIARTKPRKQLDHLDPAYRWDATDALLLGLRRWRITPVVTIVGTPRWANGGRGPAYTPRSRSHYASFVVAVAERYPWVRRWTIWNEPNKSWQLRPTRPRVYTRTLLNPATRH